MERPKAISGRLFVSELSYEGEYYQPDDRVYLKAVADTYFNFLEEKIRKNFSFKGNNER